MLPQIFITIFELNSFDLRCLYLFHVSAESVRPFTMSLRDDLMNWFLFIHEMWTGKLLSEELKDPSIVQLAARNVLLVDAYVRRFVR